MGRRRHTKYRSIIVALSNKDGQCVVIGSVCQFVHNKRTAGAKAATFTRLYSLSKTDFDYVANIYPLFRTIMEQIANARAKRTQRTKPEKKKDEGEDVMKRQIKRLRRLSLQMKEPPKGLEGVSKDDMGPKGVLKGRPVLDL